MDVVIPAAGEARRLGDLAPDGLKCLVDVAGRAALEVQLTALPLDTDRVYVVCRSHNAHLLDGWPVEVIIDDSLAGPESALRKCPLTAPTLVIYSDTLFDAVPETRSESWCGVGLGRGPRVWDVRHAGYCTRTHVEAHRIECVCAGMYYFDDPLRLRWALSEPTFAVACNTYDLARDELIEGWRDVGDRAGLCEVAR